MTFVTGTTTVTTFGTRVQVRNTNDKVLSARFRAKPGNTGNAAVGDSAVSMTNGWTLVNAAVAPYEQFNFREFQGSVLASVFYVDAATNGDKVEWAMIVA